MVNSISFQTSFKFRSNLLKMFSAFYNINALYSVLRLPVWKTESSTYCEMQTFSFLLQMRAVVTLNSSRDNESPCAKRRLVLRVI